MKVRWWSLGALALAACSPETTLDVSLVVESGIDLPTGVADLFRKHAAAVDDDDGRRIAPEVSEMELGTIGFDGVQGLQVPRGSISLMVLGFQPSGLCDELSEENLFGTCYFEHWEGLASVWVADEENPYVGVAPEYAVEPGGELAIEILMREQCACEG